MSGEGLTFAQGLAALSPVVGWLLVILGWKLVSNDNNRREQRKEIRAQINDFVRDVRDVEAKGHRYYQLNRGDPEAKSLGTIIKKDIGNLKKCLDRLKMASVGGVEATKFHTALRQQLTGRTFETLLTSTDADDSTRMLEISSAATDLVDQVEKDFFARYNPKEKFESGPSAPP